MIAKLEIGDGSFFGISFGNNPYCAQNCWQITIQVNAITKQHAEADAFQQAVDAGITGGKARLIVDRDLCTCCEKLRLKSIVKQLAIEELEAIAPSGRQIIKPG